MWRAIKQCLGLVGVFAALMACSSQQQAQWQPDTGAMAPTDSGTSEYVVPPGQREPVLPAGAAELSVEEQVCVFDCEPMSSPLDRPLNTAAHMPPALSGGTLLATRDAKWLIAADPDRDRVYFIDVEQGTLSHVRELPAGAEPGRLIEDGAGRIHVALRGRGALLSLNLSSDSQMTERAVCSQPRGLAYDAEHDSLHVACADGSLVSLGADVDAAVTRRLDLGRDLHSPTHAACSSA